VKGCHELKRLGRHIRFELLMTAIGYTTILDLPFSFYFPKPCFTTTEWLGGSRPVFGVLQISTKVLKDTPLSVLSAYVFFLTLVYIALLCLNTLQTLDISAQGYNGDGWAHTQKKNGRQSGNHTLFILFISIHLIGCI